MEHWHSREPSARTSRRDLNKTRTETYGHGMGESRRDRRPVLVPTDDGTWSPDGCCSSLNTPMDGAGQRDQPTRLRFGSIVRVRRKACHVPNSRERPSHGIGSRSSDSRAASRWLEIENTYVELSRPRFFRRTRDDETRSRRASNSRYNGQAGSRLMHRTRTQGSSSVQAAMVQEAGFPDHRARLRTESPNDASRR